MGPNSHTHNDHVGGNWQFDSVYAMDTAFTRKNALGSREDAQEEVAPEEICGTLRRFRSEELCHPALEYQRHRARRRSIRSRRATIELMATPGHTPDAITLIDRANGLLFTGDTYYPARIWLFRPETNLEEYGQSFGDWPPWHQKSKSCSALITSP